MKSLDEPLSYWERYEWERCRRLWLANCECVELAIALAALLESERSKVLVRENWVASDLQVRLSKLRSSIVACPIPSGLFEAVGPPGVSALSGLRTK